MRSPKAILVLAISLLALTTSGYGQHIEKPPIQEISGRIAWHYDYAAAKRLSKESNQPLFVVFRCER